MPELYAASDEYDAFLFEALALARGIRTSQPALGVDDPVPGHIMSIRQGIQGVSYLACMSTQAR